MGTKKSRLDDNEILCAVLQSSSYADAAKLLGVSKQTISRRMKDEQLKSRVIEIRKDLLDAINMKLIEGATKAVDVLISLMDSENEISQYNSASRILGLTQDIIETQDLINQIDKLKAEAELRKGD